MQIISLNSIKYLTYMVLNKRKLENWQAPIPLHSTPLLAPPGQLQVHLLKGGHYTILPFQFRMERKWGWLMDLRHVGFN